MLPLGLDSFACGATRFNDSDTTGNVRIMLPVRFAHRMTIPAIVDTGAPYSILVPDTADALGIDRSAGVRSDKTINVRGRNFEGWLCRVPVTLEAQEGTGLEFEATVFIPELRPGDEWPTELNFVGLQGFLFWIRVAIDPARNLFYFGGPV